MDSGETLRICDSHLPGRESYNGAIELVKTMDTVYSSRY